MDGMVDEVSSSKGRRRGSLDRCLLVLARVRLDTLDGSCEAEYDLLLLRGGRVADVFASHLSAVGLDTGGVSLPVIGSSWLCSSWCSRPASCL